MSYFVEVVKARSFRGAAQALGMPNSTLSRKINELEKFIGLRLLHRTTRKIELTEAGQIYYERSRRIIDEARLAHEQLVLSGSAAGYAASLFAGRFCGGDSRAAD